MYRIWIPVFGKIPLFSSIGYPVKCHLTCNQKVTGSNIRFFLRLGLIHAFKIILLKSIFNLILGNKKNEVNKCVKSSKDQRLSPGVPLQWENQMFSIPAIPPTIKSCKFIKVSYLLEVSLEEFLWNCHFCTVKRRPDRSLLLALDIQTAPFPRNTILRCKFSENKIYVEVWPRNVQIRPESNAIRSDRIRKVVWQSDQIGSRLPNLKKIENRKQLKVFITDKFRH